MLRGALGSDFQRTLAAVQRLYETCREAGSAYSDHWKKFHGPGGSASDSISSPQAPLEEA